MTTFSIELGPIFDELDQGLLVLTPNHRTSVQLLEAYGVYRKNNNFCLVCPSPKVYPVDIWIRDSWETLTFSAQPNTQPCLILDSVQELQLWQDIICNSMMGNKLLNQNATALKVQSAYQTLLQWQIPVHELQVFSTSISLEGSPYEDIDVFLEWLNAYEKRLLEDNSINLSQLLPKFISALKLALVKLPRKILLLGFDNPPPLYQTLFSQLEKQEIKLTSLNLQTFSPSLDIKTLPGKSEEFNAAAAWANMTIMSIPKAKIGIICPDLHRHVIEIKRAFMNNFYPEQILRDVNSDSLFSTTASESLISLPIIETALSLFALNNSTINTLEACLLIRSPFIINAEVEADARAELEYQLRHKAEVQLNLSELRRLSHQEDKPWSCPTLALALMNIELLHRQNKGKKTTKQWVEVFEQHLNLIAWPGQRILGASETQQLQLWYGLLKDFINIAHISPLLTYSEAVEYLTQLACKHSSSIFFNQAQVQILSPIEAAGIQFSHLWFMGLSERDWPPVNNCTPFIPITIQKKYRVPGVSPELLYQEAKECLRQLIQSTHDEVVLSHPEQVDDVTVQASMLLNEYKQNKINQAVQIPSSECNTLHPSVIQQHKLTIKNNNSATTTIEQVKESLYLPLENDEESKGGTALIADQAACPFRSFANKRLLARELPRLRFGLPAYEVGNMLHHAMEAMWQHLTSQQSLEELNPTDRLKLINSAASSAVQISARRFPQTMSPQYSRLETERLSTLLDSWLEQELKRGFFKIIDHEHKLQWQFSTLTLNFRIDRVEQFSDNSVGLVDYKTSKSNYINWLDIRQEKPQLLLYLLAAEQQAEFPAVSSLLYAQVNIEENKFRGIAEGADVYPGVSLDKQLPDSLSWEALKHHWQQSLEAIAQEFLDGYIAISPKSLSSCQYCHLTALCRINEIRQRL